MTQYVLPGHTFVLKGTLAQADTLVADPGTAHKHGGTVLVRAKALNDGTINLLGGIGYSAGPSRLIDSGVLTNAGSITVNGTDLSYPNTYYGALLEVTGTLINDLDITINGLDRYKSLGGGTLSVSGTLQNSGHIVLDGESGGALLDVSGTMTNTGTLTAFAAGGLGFNTTNHGGTIDVTGVLTNSGLVMLQGSDPPYDYDVFGRGSELNDAGVITNSGTILVEGYGIGVYKGATLAVTGTLANTDIVTVQPGGLLTVASGGTLTNAGTLTVDGADNFGGRASFAPPESTFSVAGSVTNTGSLYLTGGIPGLNSTYFYAQYGAVGAQMTVSGTFTNLGDVTAGGGRGEAPANGFVSGTGTGATLTVSGVLVNEGNIGLEYGLSYLGQYILSPGTGAVLIDSGVLTNTGEISLIGGYSTQTASFTVTASATLTDSGGIDGGGTLHNAGLISSGANGVTTGELHAALVNDGTVVVAESGAFVVGNFAGVTADAGDTGLFDISTNGTLVLFGTIAASQTVAFLSSPGSLVLDTPIGFAGTLDGLAPRDSIDLVNLAVKSASTSGTTLKLGLTGGTTLDLALGAPLTGVSFGLTSDGHGGTDLTVDQSPGAPAGGGAPHGLTAHSTASPGLSGTIFVHPA